MPQHQSEGVESEVPMISTFRGNVRFYQGK